ncbi:MAG: hypothetical protein OXG53_16540 [Chloroflexi bacterium]|nr:hypothetical protein [Chloroflexota bacterium]
MDLNWINMLESAIPAFALLVVCYLTRRYDSWQREIRDMDQLSIPRDTIISTSLERGCKEKRKRSSLNGDTAISSRLPRNDGNKRDEQLRREMTTQNEQLRTDMTYQIEQLRHDMTRQDERLRHDMTRQDEQLRHDMNTRFDAVEARLRGVETEQARLVGLLEGLALTDRLPAREDALD